MARKKTTKAAAKAAKKEQKAGTFKARFSHEQRLEMVKRVEAGETQTAVAADYDVSRAYVSLLWQDYLKEGEEGLKPKPMGRKRLRRLTDAEKKKIHGIITSHEQPSGAGLKTRGEDDVWSYKTVVELIERELDFKPGKTELSRILHQWRISQPRTAIAEAEDFDEDYYRYINSDVGKEVARREAEIVKRWESETPKPKRRGRPPGSKNKSSKTKAVDDFDDDDLDYADIEAVRKELRRNSIGARALAPKPNQRTGKHRKGSRPGPKRKKKRKGRK